MLLLEGYHTIKEKQNTLKTHVEEEIMINRKIVSAVLDREVSEKDMLNLEEYWKAFHDDPVTYIGTGVISIINQYLDVVNS